MKEKQYSHPARIIKLSIIVPVYNVDKYLKQCLDSLINQTLKDIEIICVNDGSTDGSLAILKEYANKEKRIILIDKKNGGLSSARNAGIKIAKGEYIGFVDSDDWVDETMYEKLYERAHESGSDVAICGINEFDDLEGVVKNQDPYYSLDIFPKTLDKYTFNERDTRDIVFGICVTAVDKIYRRDFLITNEIAFPEGLLFEDNPFFFEVYLAAKKISLVRERLYFYRLNREGAITEKFGRKHFDVMEIQDRVADMFKKYGLGGFYKLKLIENRVYATKRVFEGLSDDLRKEFVALLKDDLNSLSLNVWTLLRLTRESYGFIYAITKMKDYSSAEYNRLVSDSVAQRTSLELSLKGRIITILSRMTDRLARLLLKFRIYSKQGPIGLARFGALVLRLVMTRIRSSVISPIRVFLGNHLSESTRRRLKYIFKLSFLRLVVTRKNKPYQGPMVTLVSTFYNQADIIMETVDSVLDQYFVDFEYLIVNDGSKPEERKVLDQIKDSRVRIVDTEHIGHGSPAAARNLGLGQAKGKYVMCLDGDDKIDPTYLEKFVTVLETDPNIDIVTSNMRFFGGRQGECHFGKFKPQRQLRANLVSCASMFRKEYFRRSGGFKPGIGYEDWEYWTNLVELGARAKNIGDKILIYREAENSRYKQDNKNHRSHFLAIAGFHRLYRLKVLAETIKRFFVIYRIDSGSAYINLGKDKYNYGKKSPHILVAIPWMTYGGAETLVKNITGNLVNDFEFTFMTGKYSANDLEQEFQAITERVYHLPGLFNDNRDYYGFVDNYIKTRKVDVLHVFHNEFLFNHIVAIKKSNPSLKIIITLFNDKTSFLKKSLELKSSIDLFTSDNKQLISLVKRHDKKIKTAVINNGLDYKNVYNPDNYNRGRVREGLRLTSEDTGVLFMGRLSIEKNPEYFLRLAQKTIQLPGVKFFVVGSGPLEKKLFKKYGSLGNVNFLGYRKDIPEILSAVDVFLLPSLIEGSPQSIIEAMAMGKTVIASNVGGVADVINDGVNGYFLPESLEATANLISEIKKANPGVGDSARKTVQADYSLSQMVTNYRKMYQDLLGKQ